MYAAQSDITAAIGEDRLLLIADRDNDGVVDAAVVSEALLDAAAEIDSAVGGRYKLPMTPVPRRLRRIAVDIAQFHLDPNPSEDLMARVKDARAFLVQVSKGIMTLSDAALIGDDKPSEEGSQTDLAARKSFKSALDTEGFL